jgi:hypothetical protein
MRHRRDTRSAPNTFIGRCNPAFRQGDSVKKFIALLAILGLSGCVAYGVPYGSANVYYSDSPYYYGSPYYGSSVYIHGSSGGYTHAPRHRRDRHHEGVSKWRDRDGDGVSNRRDAYPRDPSRR